MAGKVVYGDGREKTANSSYDHAAKARVARYEKAKTAKYLFRSLYREAYMYSMPQRESFDDHAAGEQKLEHLYDSTTTVAAATFASKMQSGLTPPFKRWTRLEAGWQVEEGQRQTLNEELRKIEDVMFEVLNESNFNTQVTEFYLDLGVGTGAMFIAEGFGDSPINFQAVPLSQLTLEDGPFGTVDAVYREYTMPARNVAHTWPKATIPEELRKKWEAAPDEKVTLLESTIKQYKNDAGVVTSDYEYSVIVLKECVEIYKDRFEVSPWIIARWMTIPGEVYGRGPILAALPDTKTLNAVVEMILRNAALSIAGCYTVAHDAVMNVETLTIEPASFIPVLYNESANGRAIDVLPRAGDFEMAQIIIKDLQNKINRSLYVNPLGDLEQPVRSATEVAIRQQELADNTGSAFGRINFEFIKPAVRRILYLLDKQGMIKLPKGMKLNGQDVKIIAQSPLAEAQNMEDLLKMDRWLEFIGTRFGPQGVMLAAKLDEIGPRSAELLGLPEDLFNDAAEQTAIKAQAMQAVASPNETVAQTASNAITG